MERLEVKKDDLFRMTEDRGHFKKGQLVRVEEAHHGSNDIRVAAAEYNRMYHPTRGSVRVEHLKLP